MIRRSWIAPSAFILILIAGSACSFSQVMGGIVGSIGVSSPSINQQPYTLTRKTTLVQKLFDGTMITRITTNEEAHDSQGRMYHKTQMEMSGMGPNRPDQFSFFVNDPIARVNMNWMSQSKEVNVFHIPEPRARLVQPPPVVKRVTPPAINGTSADTNGATPGNVVAVAPPPILRTLPDTTNRPKIQRDHLDAKNIAGVYAEGTRITTTYPIGWFGNDRPIVTVQENWVSPELHIPMLTIMDDPRTGTRTTEVTALDRSEPSNTLFQAPEGYKVHDQNPQQSEPAN